MLMEQSSTEQKETKKWSRGIVNPWGWKSRVLQCVSINQKEGGCTSCSELGKVQQCHLEFLAGSSENVHIISAQGQEEVKEDNEEDK